jgi:hypothetical protein
MYLGTEFARSLWDLRWYFHSEEGIDMAFQAVVITLRLSGKSGSGRSRSDNILPHIETTSSEKEKKCI